MLESITATFSELGERWSRREYDDDDLTKAIGTWMGYPSLRQQITYSHGASEFQKMKARKAVNSAHAGAARLLLETAMQFEIDGGPILESARLCQDLYDRDPDRFIRDDHTDRWPDCLDVSGLSNSECAVIRSGEVAFMLLVTKSNLDLDKIGNSFKKGSPRDPAVRDLCLDIRRECSNGKGVAKMIHQFCDKMPKKYKFVNVKTIVYRNDHIWRKKR